MEEIKVDVSNNSSKSNGKISLVLPVIIASIVFFIMMVAIVFVVMDDSRSNAGKVDVISSKLNYEYSEYLGYDVSVTGTIKNNTSKDYSYVSVEFSVYDENGNNLGTVLDNINNLGAGESWNFSASLLYTDEKPVSYKLKSITKW